MSYAENPLAKQLQLVAVEVGSLITKYITAEYLQVGNSICKFIFSSVRLYTSPPPLAAEIRKDVSSQYHTTLLTGDVAERVRILKTVGLGWSVCLSVCLDKRGITPEKCACI